MRNCKTVTTMSCVNQFFSFLTLVGCSDRSVRVYDLNQGKVVRSLAGCHSRPVHTIIQNQAGWATLIGRAQSRLCSDWWFEPNQSEHSISTNERGPLWTQGSPRLSHPDRGYDLFLTAALGDGASLWDLRQLD